MWTTLRHTTAKQKLAQQSKFQNVTKEMRFILRRPFLIIFDETDFAEIFQSTAHTTNVCYIIFFCLYNRSYSFALTA